MNSEDNLNIMNNLLEVLNDEIGKYTSKSFAVILLSGNIMKLRDEHNCFNYVLINENRYTEGINALTVSEEIGNVETYKFYRAVKALIDNIVDGFENDADMFFINSLRQKLPNIFIAIDNLGDIKQNAKKQQIMIVDDNFDLIETVKKCLHSVSDEYNVTGANSGVECFDLLAGDYLPELIILDIMMPGMKGWDIIERLNGNSKWKNIPIVILSAKTDADTKKNGMKFAKDFIEKPFEISDLKRRIDKVLYNTEWKIANNE